MATVHSYTRFSSLEAPAGESRARQAEVAERFGRAELERAAAESAAKAKRIEQARRSRRPAAKAEGGA